MNEYGENINKLEKINQFLRTIASTYNHNYDYIKLNFDLFKKWIYQEVMQNNLLLCSGINNIEKYNYNLTNNIVYYIQNRGKNNDVSIKQFIDMLEHKPYINKDDNMLINYMIRIHRYYQRYILEQLVLANYENNTQYVLSSELMNYINNGTTKNLYRYRMNDKTNYRKCLIENINPNELYIVIFSRLIEINKNYKYQSKSKEEIIGEYVDLVIINQQKKLLECIVKNCYTKYGLVVTINMLYDYITKTSDELVGINREYSRYIKKYLKQNKLMEIINQLLNNRGIDTNSMNKEEIIDTYIYSIGRELGKTL